MSDTEFKKNFESKFASCDICADLYNRNQRKPYVICSNLHTMCQKCLGKFETDTCPFCRQEFDKEDVKVNRYILELLPEEKKVVDQVKKKHNYIKKVDPLKEYLDKQPRFYDMGLEQRTVYQISLMPVQNRVENNNTEQNRPYYQPEYPQEREVVVTKKIESMIQVKKQNGHQVSGNNLNNQNDRLEQALHIPLQRQNRGTGSDGKGRDHPWLYSMPIAKADRNPNTDSNPKEGQQFWCCCCFI